MALCVLWKCWQSSETGMHPSGRKSMNCETISGSKVKDGVAQGARAALGRQGLLG